MVGLVVVFGSGSGKLKPLPKTRPIVVLCFGVFVVGGGRAFVGVFRSLRSSRRRLTARSFLLPGLCPLDCVCCPCYA